jgi:hypothetical protein
VERKLVRLKEKYREVVLPVGWGCSNCGWKFEARLLSGETVEDWIDTFVDQREEDFRGHDCGDFPKRSSK